MGKGYSKLYKRKEEERPKWLFDNSGNRFMHEKKEKRKKIKI